MKYKISVQNIIENVNIMFIKVDLKFKNYTYRVSAKTGYTPP